MVTDQFNHAPAQIFLNTGSALIGRPSMGSWLTYGLGSENQNLPGFVVLLSGPNGPDGGTSLWGSGFLPSIYQGVQFRSQGDPVLYVSNPPGMDAADAAAVRSMRSSDLNRMQLADIGDPETLTRIRPIRTRLSDAKLRARVDGHRPRAEAHIHELYGTEPGKVSFANNCLLARRLVERGVRFVQLYHWGWDSHGTNPGDDIVHSLPERCKQTDQASAALVQDLETARAAGRARSSSGVANSAARR